VSKNSLFTSPRCFQLARVTIVLSLIIRNNKQRLSRLTDRSLGASGLELNRRIAGCDSDCVSLENTSTRSRSPPILPRTVIGALSPKRARPLRRNFICFVIRFHSLSTAGRRQSRSERGTKVDALHDALGCFLPIARASSLALCQRRRECFAFYNKQFSSSVQDPHRECELISQIWSN